MAGLIPREFIDELLNRVDIVEIIEQRVPLKQAGKDYKACCPFHSEKTPSFHVIPDKQFYYCFGCGASGSALTFLMDYDRLDFVESVEFLAESVSMPVPREDAAVQPRKPLDPLYAVMQQASRSFQYQLRHHAAAGKAKDYLKGRGMSGQIAAEFGIGFAPPGWDRLAQELPQQQHEAAIEAGLLVRREDGSLYDRFRERIMFPIRNRRGQLVGFGGRVLGQEEPKYLNSPETPLFHKGRELYGLYELRQARCSEDSVLVVEGYMDVLALAQHGVRNVVATLGTATTAEHVERLFRTAKDIVFCFDGDAAGRRAAGKALEQALPLLKEGRTAYFLFMPEGEDPDTVIRSEGPGRFQDRAHWTSLSTFLFDRAASELDLQRLEDRARLVERAGPLLARIPAPALRSLLNQQLARLAVMDSKELQPIVERAIQQAPEPEAAQPIRRPLRRKRAVHRSLIREGIKWLLLLPQLASHIEQAQRFMRLAETEPGITIFIELIEQIQAQPTLNTGQILERWHDRPEGRHLSALISEERLIDDETASQRFQDLLKRLESQLHRQRFKELMGRLESLSEPEKSELQDLQQTLPGKK